ncbi:hypothetical protein ACJRO7_022774 [Eucalyptus globulus]|uniref:Uncharacterized protein n=1 Tax=Eucalyptus globulus TaxID=34317 RepID=A0ABD3K057_EUCGL
MRCLHLSREIHLITRVHMDSGAVESGLCAKARHVLYPSGSADFPLLAGTWKVHSSFFVCFHAPSPLPKSALLVRCSTSVLSWQLWCSGVDPKRLSWSGTCSSTPRSTS